MIHIFLPKKRLVIEQDSIYSSFYVDFKLYSICYWLQTCFFCIHANSVVVISFASCLFDSCYILCCINIVASNLSIVLYISVVLMKEQSFFILLQQIGISCFISFFDIQTISFVRYGLVYINFYSACLSLEHSVFESLWENEELQDTANRS